MPKTIEIECWLSGQKELEAALAELPNALAKQVLLAAAKEAARPIVSAARSRAPKADQAIIRKFKNKRGVTSRIRTFLPGEGAKSIKVRTNSKLKPVGVSIGPDRMHFYMAFAEWGAIHEAPRPFLRPAWDEGKDALLKSLEGLIWKALAKKARQVAKKAESGTLSKKLIASFRI